MTCVFEWFQSHSQHNKAGPTKVIQIKHVHKWKLGHHNHSLWTIPLPKKLKPWTHWIGETLNPRPPPIELCPAHVFLVFLHMFFGLTWFCIKPRSTVLHVLLFSKRILLSSISFSCLPAHVFWPCMVLHKSIQHGSHGSTCSFIPELVCKLILLAKWSNKQKTKVLCSQGLVNSFSWSFCLQNGFTYLYSIMNLNTISWPW